MTARCAGLACLAVLGAAPSASGAEYQMTATANSTAFSPSELTVNPGDGLTVSKEAGVYEHNVRFPDTATSCPAAPTTEAWSCQHDFTQLGDFVLHCDLHTYMTARVHVVEPGSGGPPPADPPTGDAARLVRLRKAASTSAAGQAVTLRLRLSRKALAAEKRGLAVRRRLRASVRVTATDAAGNRTSTVRRIALRR